MKTLKLTLLLFLFTLTVISQNIKNKGFNINEGYNTNEKVIIESDTFDLYLSYEGYRYIKYKNKHGKYYPVWIGSKTKHIYNKQTVYISLKGKYYIYKLSKKNKIPYAVYVDVN